MKVPATAATAWPRVTFTSETTLHLNGDEIRLVPVPPAHTDGDIIVRFEKADVIHAGDVFFNGRYPLIDYSTGGWIGGMITATKTLSGMTTSKTRIIPGHGPLATREDLRGYLIFLETMLERFTKLKNEGRSVDEVVAAAPAKEFDEKLGQGFITPEQFVRITYTGLLKH
jgi:cyclase